MKVERTERRVSRGYTSVGLGSKETDTGQNTGDPRVMESSMLKKCHYLENGSDL